MKSSSVYRNKTIEKLKIKSDLLGKNYNIILLLNMRLLICLCLFVIFSLINKIGIIIGILIAIISYYLLEYCFFDRRIINRRKTLEQDSLSFFSLLNICLKEEKSVYNSLEIVSNSQNSLLAKEFRISLKGCSNVNDLPLALDIMKKKIPSDIVNNMLLAMSDSLHNNDLLCNSLDIQLEHLRSNINSNINSKISLMPIKMNIISILFIIILGSLIYYLLFLLEYM